jgi:hypothetical protein
MVPPLANACTSENETDQCLHVWDYSIRSRCRAILSLSLVGQLLVGSRGDGISIIVHSVPVRETYLASRLSVALYDSLH